VRLHRAASSQKSWSGDATYDQAMPVGVAVPLFCLALVVTLYAAAVFTERLDHFGERLGLPEAILGVLTAVAADGPELSSAISALARGRHDVGLGVVAGANVFILAGALGGSALIAGPIVIRRETLALEGSLGLGASGAIALFALNVIPVWAAVAIIGTLIAVYLLLIAFAEEGGVPPRPRHLLQRALGARHPTPRHREKVSPKNVALMLAAAAAIVLGSTVMVRSALTLGDAANVPDILVGTLLLAVLASLPNVYAGIRLGLARRDAALVSEAMNSITINLAGGVAVPALFVTFDSTGLEKADLLLLFAMTTLTVVLLATKRGLRRLGGALLIGVWIGFAVAQIVVNA
jgi:cation:H+ antiporter